MFFVVFFLAPHIGCRLITVTEFSYHGNENYGTLLLNFGNTDLLVVDFEFGTQASHMN